MRFELVIAELHAPALSLLATAIEPTARATVLGWGVADLPMLILLPVLLVLSGFFSGSETALFGLSESERMRLRRTPTIAGRAVEALLHDQRGLLVTILLGNTTVNVLYFVISSVLMLRSAAGPAGQVGLAVAFLFIIVLVGEIGPKVFASAARMQFVALTAPPLLTVHTVIAPLRAILADGIIAPLSRLTAPHHPPRRLDDEELRELLTVSGREGVIDPEEQRMLGEVLALSRLKVRDVMTPRVRMAAVAEDATRDDVIELVREARRTQAPVYRGNLDHIVGMLHVKRFALDPDIRAVTDPEVMTPPHFVPEVARLDQLLDHFRRSQVQSVVVVDEFGGTQGVVSVEDVVEEIVGDIVAPGEVLIEPPRLIGLGRWRVSGEMSLHEWAEAFEISLESPEVATLGGLIVERLGRAPEIGDAVVIDHVRLEVEQLEQSRVVAAILTLLPDSVDESPVPEGQR
jgi:putative hemolysin